MLPDPMLSAQIAYYEGLRDVLQASRHEAGGSATNLQTLTF